MAESIWEVLCKSGYPQAYKQPDRWLQLISYQLVLNINLSYNGWVQCECNVSAGGFAEGGSSKSEIHGSDNRKPSAECFTANRLAKLGPITSTVNNECAALNVRLKTTVDVFMSFLFAWCSSVCLQYMENSTYMYMYHHAYLHSNCFENTPVRIPSIHVYIKIII